MVRIYTDSFEAVSLSVIGEKIVLQKLHMLGTMGFANCQNKRE